MRTTLSCIALSLVFSLWSAESRADNTITENGCAYTPGAMFVGPGGGRLTVFEVGDPSSCGSGHGWSWFTDTSGVLLYQLPAPPWTMYVDWSFTVLPNNYLEPRMGMWGPVIIYQHCGPCVKHSRLKFRGQPSAGGVRG